MAVFLFSVVYLGMVLGGIPGLALDRTGIALLAGLLLIAFGSFTSSELITAIDWPTIAMLFGLMVLSGQFYFSGFYYALIRKIQMREMRPQWFLFFVIFISGILSAALLNDIVCLAFTPLIIQVCRSKNWHPKPALLGLVTAANVGSSMTLIGNPQNIFISESIHLSFGKYSYHAFFPAALGLFLIWIILRWQTKDWFLKTNGENRLVFPSFQTWQILKAGTILIALLLLLFFSSLPRYQLVLSAAGILLLSRKMTSEKFLGFIDWQVLVLFFGLFLTNAAFLNTETAKNSILWIQGNGWDLSNPTRLVLTSIALTNLVSNVPAVILLTPFIHTSAQGTLLALSSTLAGNLFLIGSVANLIVVSKAKECGLQITAKDHLKAGIPITISTLLLSMIWLYWTL